MIIKNLVDLKVQTFSYIIIFGAAVKVNGEPSGAMKRRVDAAILTSKELSEVLFIVTGGIGAGKTISEADAMKKLLIESGIPNGMIIIENQASDTLSSVIYCHEILKTHNNAQDVFVCSDTYHIPRCRWLFFLFGIPTKSSKTISGKKVNGILKWIYYYIRELAAIPYDTLLTYLHKLGIMR